MTKDFEKETEQTEEVTSLKEFISLDFSNFKLLSFNSDLPETICSFEAIWENPIISKIYSPPEHLN